MIQKKNEIANTTLFRKALKDGLPICFGYIPVSFAFGVMAREGGLPIWSAVLISMTNFTSAGQVAGTSLILSGGTYLEIAVTTFVINIRYMLMSFSLSQKLDEKMSLFSRCLLAFGNTDEIFAVAMQQRGSVNASYLSGLMLAPYIGWGIGTLLGATAISILPNSVRSALGISIYAMFLAIMIPPSKTSKPILVTILMAATLSCLIKWIPIFSFLSGGWPIILCAILASAVSAVLYPVHQKEE